jgi:tetratricopeptide (TPR) repeat protein
MPFRLNIIGCLLLLLVLQSPQDAIRRHYEAAEAARLAGNLDAAESEYKAILAEGYLRLGRVYSARSEYPRAVLMLEGAQSYGADSPEIMLDLAVAYFGAQQYEKALVPASKLLAIAPSNAGAHQMLGKTYFMLGDLPKSIAELEAANKLTPSDVDVAYTLGIAYLRNRQTAAAKQLYTSLINSLGEQPQLHVIVGRAYRQSGLLPEAAAEFKQAIALDANFPRAHYYLGITYLLDEGQSRIAEALEEFRTEVAANPDEFFANYYLGVVYNFQRQWDQAIKSLRKASSIQPDNPDPYYQLGQAYQELNDHTQAIEVLRKAIALNPDLAHNKGQVTTAHHRLAQSLLKSGQTEAGRKELQLAADLKAQAFKLEQQTQTDVPGMGQGKSPEPDKDLTLSGGNQPGGNGNDLDESARRELQSSEDYYKKIVGTAHNNVGLLRAERQDFVAAAAQFSLATKWYPQQEGLDYNLGLASYKSQSYKQAASALQSESKLHPSNRPAAILLGLTLLRLENYAGAAEWLSGAIDAQSTDLDSHYALATALIKQHKADAAERVIEQIKVIRNDAPQLHLLAAEKYDADSVPKNALAELDEFAALNSNAPLVHYDAGLLYLKLGKREEAVKEFERELGLNANDMQAKYALADVLLASKHERGLALLREVVKARPEYAAARYALGKALLLSGDVAGAIDNLERATTLETESSEFHFQLGQAYLAAGRKSEGKNEVDISKQLRNPKRTNNDN